MNPMNAPQQLNCISSGIQTGSNTQARQRVDATLQILNMVSAFKVLLYLLLKGRDPTLSSVEDMILQFYVVFEVIYILSLLEVEGQRLKTICRYVNLVSGSLAFELFLWVMTSAITVILINICIIICLITCCKARPQQIPGELFSSPELNV